MLKAVPILVVSELSVENFLSSEFFCLVHVNIVE